MTDDRKPPRQEILAPQKRSTSVAPPESHNPRGIVESVTSGVVSGFQARSIEKHNDKARAQLQSIQISTDIARALKDNIISWAELEDIDNILDAYQRGRELQRLEARIRYDNDILRVNNETLELNLNEKELLQRAWDLDRENERKQQNAAALEEEARWTGRAAVEQARTRFAAHERDRLMTEMLRDIIIQTRLEIEQTKEAEAKYKKAMSLAALQRAVQPTAPDLGQMPVDALTTLRATIQNRMDLARQRSDPTEVGLCAMFLADIDEIMRKR